VIPIKYIKDKKEKYNYRNGSLFSIITVVHNSSKYLEKTIQSLINQKKMKYLVSSEEEDI